VLGKCAGVDSLIISLSTFSSSCVETLVNDLGDRYCPEHPGIFGPFEVEIDRASIFTQEQRAPGPENRSMQNKIRDFQKRSGTLHPTKQKGSRK
jgi:hypothetical protein